MAVLTGCGGCLLLWPLHVHLPYAGLLVLQERGHQLQGECALLADLLHPSNQLEKLEVDEKLNLEVLASAGFFIQPLFSEMSSIRVFATEIKSLIDFLAQMEEVKQRNKQDRKI